MTDFNSLNPATPRDDSAIKNQLEGLLAPKTAKTREGQVVPGEKTDTKVNNTAQKKLAETAKSKDGSSTYELLDNGAVKKVWVGYTPSGTKNNSGNQFVFYTAKKSFRDKKEKELKNEVRTMQTIESRLTKTDGDTTNLAVTAETVKEGHEVGGHYTVKTERATGGNFEKALRSKNTSMASRRNFGLNFLSGLKNLAQAKFSYGDMKPENCMIYGEGDDQHLKIGDFGKAKEGEGSHDYKGNTRFAPPEGKQSIKGDVWSGAMVLIRNFEEAVLDEGENSLIPKHELREDYDMKASSSLRGVERYVVEHKAFLATNPGLSIKGLKNRFMMGKLSKTKRNAQQKAMERYIEALCKRLVRERKMEPYEAGKLESLLKHMTKAEPGERVNIEGALKLYDSIQFTEVS